MCLKTACRKVGHSVCPVRRALHEKWREQFGIKSKSSSAAAASKAAQKPVDTSKAGSGLPTAGGADTSAAAAEPTVPSVATMAAPDVPEAEAPDAKRQRTEPAAAARQLGAGGQDTPGVTAKEHAPEAGEAAVPPGDPASAPAAAVVPALKPVFMHGLTTEAGADVTGAVPASEAGPNVLRAEEAAQKLDAEGAAAQPAGLLRSTAAAEPPSQPATTDPNPAEPTQQLALVPAEQLQVAQQVSEQGPAVAALQQPDDAQAAPAEVGGQLADAGPRPLPADMATGADCCFYIQHASCAWPYDTVTGDAFLFHMLTLLRKRQCVYGRISKIGCT